MNQQFYSSQGQVIRLGKKVGFGGEGTVFSIEGHEGFAAKIYKPEISKSRQAKIEAIVKEKWYLAASEVAFPIDMIWTPQKEFAGFTMRLLGGRRPIHEAYNPSSRRLHFPKASFPFLLRIALNAANAVAKVHATGCVVGDLNHSGFLVAPDATVSMIDADSFQVLSKGQLFPCRVGVPEYTAPELQGVNLGAALRTANHDAFALAALVFYILFMGRHPYAGRPMDHQTLDLNEAIKTCQFAYSLETPQPALKAPLHGPLLSDVPAALASMFERAFGKFGISNGRPTAVEWIKALANSEKQLRSCANTKSHHHFQTAPDCPWCRMEKALPGFTAFGPTHHQIAGSSQVDVGQYVAALQAVTDLGPPPDIETILAKPGSPKPTERARLIARKAAQRLAFGLLASAISVGSAFGALYFEFTEVWLATLSAAMFSFVALLFATRLPREAGSLKNDIAKARSDWAKQKADWQDAASETPLAKLKDAASKTIQELSLLPQQEKLRLKALGDNRQTTQKLKFLERYTLKDSGLPELSKSRFEKLKTVGILNAADLAKSSRAKVARIKGCKSLAPILFTWLATLEKGFVYNPQLGVSPTEMLRVKNEMLVRRGIIEKRLLSEIKAAEEMRELLLKERAQVRPEVEAAWIALQQAERDEKAIRRRHWSH
jgi:DNA-binding helix-hairpin-helix protein with protein kinase domain